MTDDHPDATSEARTASGIPIVDPGIGRHGSDEPMTGPQRIYLKTLCREAGEPFDDSLTNSEATRRIEELQGRLPGRGFY